MTWLSRFASSLRCPNCKGVVKLQKEDIICQGCGKYFANRSSVVYFVPRSTEHPIHDDADALMVRCKNIAKHFPYFYKVLMTVFGASAGGLSPEMFLRLYTFPNQLILNLGSGSGVSYLHVVNVDLFAFPNVHVVADISNLPFNDESVDALMCAQVLEHVREPQMVVGEMLRVLKPGGYAYLTTPFVYPYHASPHDYTRWTLDGLRVLTNGLQEVRAGLRHGPTSSLVIILGYWLAVVCGLGSRRLFEIFKVIWMTLLAPFAHIFDALLNRLGISENIASGYYIVVRKPQIFS